MKKNIVLLSLLVAFISFVVCGTLNTASAQKKTINWKTTSHWTPGMDLTLMDKNYVKLVDEMAGNELKIKYYDGDSLVPVMQVLDSVQKGTLDAGFTAIEYWLGKDTAFEILSTYPMGMNGADAMNWLYGFGGLEVAQEVFKKFNVVAFPYSISPPESGIRSNKPINSLADYKGLKVRVPSRTKGQVFKDIGAAQIMMAGGEVYQALEKGVIDAAEFGTPNVDWSMGLQEVTKYWCSPGWHQPSVIYWLVINKKSWDNLPDNLKAIVKNAAMANCVWSYAMLETKSAIATQKFIEKGIKITQLSVADYKKLEALTNKYTLISSKENPAFAKIAYSMYSYLKSISKWHEIGVPFSSGRSVYEYPDLNAIKAAIK